MIDHNIDVQSVSSRAPKVVRKCESYIGFPVVRTDGRSGGRSVGRSVYGHVIAKISGNG